jgi:hypothetical protein
MSMIPILNSPALAIDALKIRLQIIKMKVAILFMYESMPFFGPQSLT